MTSILRAYGQIDIMKTLLLTAFLALSLPGLSAAQSNGDYRSASSGDWNDKNTWQEYSGGSWSTPKRAPRNTGVGQITIRSGHTVIADRRGTFDELVIEAGAVLDIDQNFSVADGPGDDLQVFGTLLVNKRVNITDSASAVFHPGSAVVIGNRDRLLFENTATGSFLGGTVTIVDGTLQIDDDAVVGFEAGSVLSNNDTIDLSGNGSLNISDSLIINSGDILTADTSTLVMNTGAVLEHAIDGGALPDPGFTVWNPGSTLELSATESTLPLNLNQDLQSVVWSVPGQTADISLNAEILSIQEDFIVESTGSGSIIWDNFGAPLSVGNDLLIRDGSLVYQVSGTGQLDVGGDLVVSSAGLLDLSSTTGAPAVDLKGDITVAGTIQTSSGDPVSVTLSGSIAQTMTVAGTWSDPFDVTVAGPGGLIMGSDLFIPGSFTEIAGGVDLGGYNLESTGDVSFSDSPTNGGTLTLSGPGTATLSSDSGSLTLVNLEVDKNPGSLTLGSDLIVTGSLSIISGSFDAAGFAITVQEGAAFFDATGTYTGTVTMSRSYTAGSDGWIMLSSPVSGPTLSTLNSAFYTQGRLWATASGGSPNVKAFDFASQSWVDVPDTDAALSPGSPIILYAFAQDASGSSLLPTTLTVTGTPVNPGPISLSYSAGPATSFNMVGNPGTSNMDWNDTVSNSTGMASSYATWDPSATSGGGTTGYRYYDAVSGTGLAGRYIAPFTAFMVESTSPSSSLVPTYSASASEANAVRYGKGATDQEPTPHIRFSVQGEGLADEEMYALLDLDHEVRKLTPLSRDWTALWMTGDDGTPVAFKGNAGTGQFEIFHATTQSGTFRVTWPDMVNVPDSLTLTLFDRDNGETIDLRSRTEYTFQSRPGDHVVPGSSLPANGSARFVFSASTSTEPAATVHSGNGALPTLAQNFPNPFNPTTTIRYAVPEASHVRLQVFDMLGRRVATLVDGSRQAGWESVTWNAGDLSSGLYVYRLDVGAQSVSRTMVLMK